MDGCKRKPNISAGVGVCAILGAERFETSGIIAQVMHGHRRRVPEHSILTARIHDSWVNLKVTEYVAVDILSKTLETRLVLKSSTAAFCTLTLILNIRSANKNGKRNS
ncbi:hypothetical protein RRG08_004751 [Elysia crispata]|uniref:Uncharacterized protein n=1 Tax=Elysia crispata TaxID=231223 RepID=A0AAE1AJU2_9GAST|nr:hypothetical protein RRG08_004751 [Elysia crispata]